MARFYLAVVQAILSYGADSWALKRRDVKRLDAFHRKSVRFMTGQHIRKSKEGVWEYPDHEILLKKCGMVRIERYIEARRSTLRGYLEKFNTTLWDEVRTVRPPARNSKKVLWWTQEITSKKELRKMIKGNALNCNNRNLKP